MPLVRKPGHSGVESKPEVAAALTALSSADPQERWAAARAAVAITGGAHAIARVLRTESDPRVREAMFTSLARMGTLESANQLLPLLRCDDAQLRTGALDALRMMTTTVAEMLPALLADPDADVRILSCELARTLPSEAACSLMCTLLAGEQQINVCAAAIDVLAEVGSAAALPVLAACGQRFRDAPFLGFAIKIATDRIQSQSASPRG